MFSDYSRQLNDRIVALLGQELTLSQRPRRTISANTVLVAHGNTTEDVYLVHSGQLHVEYYPASAQGTRVIPFGFGPGSLLMVQNVYANRPDTGVLVATTDAEILVISHQEFCGVMPASMERLLLVTECLAARLMESRIREGVWMERRVEERVAMTLTHIAGEQIRSPSCETVHLSLTHELLADRCGLSRSRVSRELKRLEDHGWIRLGRNRVELLNLDALIAAAA